MEEPLFALSDSGSVLERVWHETAERTMKKRGCILYLPWFFHKERATGPDPVAFVLLSEAAALPEIIRPENIVGGGMSRRHSQVIIHRKPLPGGYVLYCEEVRVGKKTLAFKTMYKMKQ